MEELREAILQDTFVLHDWHTQGLFFWITEIQRASLARDSDCNRGFMLWDVIRKYQGCG